MIDILNPNNTIRSRRKHDRKACEFSIRTIERFSNSPAGPDNFSKSEVG